MAVSSIAVPPDSKRDARARVLAGHVGSWPRFVLKQPWGGFEAGTTFRRATGSNGARYLVNAVACQCPDYAERGNICKHVRAYVLWEDRQARQVAGAEHRPTASPTSWRHCSQQCGALLAPEHPTKMCDPCWERIVRVLDIG